MLRKALIMRLLALAPAVFFGACQERSETEPGVQSTEAEGPLVNGSGEAQAAREEDELEALMSDYIESERAKEARKADESLVAEAIAAMQETRRAIDAIDAGDEEAALAGLEQAIGKLEILLAREPKLSRAPLDSWTQVVNFVDPGAVDDQRRMVEELVDEGNFPAARIALEDMASEIRVTTVSLPLDTYADAIRQAARLLDEGDAAEAREVLQGALATLHLIERRVPIPLIKAEYLVWLASEKSASEPEEALELLARAEEELQLAERLGYGFREHDWAELDERIRSLTEAIESEEQSGGLFDALRESLRQFKERLSGGEMST
jgi:hypothetical protein